MKIILGADHGGFELKNYIREQLQTQGYETLDLGVNDGTSVDYPDKAAEVCRALLAGEGDLGLLFCGTGIGMSLAANKFPGIRAAHVSDVYSAGKAREHNNANVLCLGGRTLGPELAWAIVQAFLTGEFAGGRHQRRVDKIMALEQVQHG